MKSFLKVLVGVILALILSVLALMAADKYHIFRINSQKSVLIFLFFVFVPLAASITYFIFRLTPALISCPSCGKNISGRAVVCPHCGRRAVAHFRSRCFACGKELVASNHLKRGSFRYLREGNTEVGYYWTHAACPNCGEPKPLMILLLFKKMAMSAIGMAVAGLILFAVPWTGVERTLNMFFVWPFFLGFALVTGIHAVRAIYYMAIGKRGKTA